VKRQMTRLSQTKLSKVGFLEGENGNHGWLGGCAQWKGAYKVALEYLGLLACELPQLSEGPVSVLTPANRDLWTDTRGGTWDLCESQPQDTSISP
jgi:hypothetical protein